MFRHPNDILMETDNPSHSVEEEVKWIEIYVIHP